MADECLLFAYSFALTLFFVLFLPIPMKVFVVKGKSLFWAGLGLYFSFLGWAGPSSIPTILSIDPENGTQ